MDRNMQDHTHDATMSRWLPMPVTTLHELEHVPCMDVATKEGGQFEHPGQQLRADPSSRAAI
jgi:hypothetical protein